MTSREEDGRDFDAAAAELSAAGDPTPSVPPSPSAAASAAVNENGAIAMPAAKSVASSAAATSSIPVGGARPKVRNGHRVAAPSSPDLSRSTARFPAQNEDSTLDRLPTLSFERQDSEEGAEDSQTPSLNGFLSEPLAADLPRSFYALDIGSDSEAGSVNNSYFHPPQGVSGAGQSNLSTEIAALIQSEMASKPSHDDEQPRACSPEAADFLEMDFDGGNSDSDDSGQGGTETNSLQEAAGGVIEAAGESGNALPMALTQPEWSRRRESSPTVPQANKSPAVPDLPGSLANQASERVGRGTTSVPAVTPVRDEPLASFMVRSRSLNSPMAQQRPTSRCEALAHAQSSRCCQASDSRNFATTRDEPFALSLKLCGAKLSQREQFIFGTQAQDPETEPSEGESRVEKSMVWSETEAFSRQVSQIGKSACGATAVINVLLALGIPHSADDINRLVRTRLRKEGAGLPEYLFSRALAGATHVDLIRGLRFGGEGKVISRFFHMYPPRKVSLSVWLSSWIKKGAIPIATLNLQKCVRPGQTVPDAWHHQMVFGVGPSGVYLTNPLERVAESVIAEQLSSPSLLLVRRNDVTQRFAGSDCDLAPLTAHANPAWDWLNVLGQVVNVLREHGSFAQANCQRELTQHVKIPASYKSGVTLCMLASNPAAEELMACPELPVIDENESVEMDSLGAAAGNPS